MRNRAAPTTAGASASPGPAGADRRGERVFGKVAGPRHDGGTGARGQDVELFDATVRLPKVSAGAGAGGGAGAPARTPRRSRHARAAAPAWRSVSLPLMLVGALSAGLGAALTVWSSAEPDPAPPSEPSLSLPVLVTRDPEPARSTAPAATPSPRASTARTTAPVRPPAGASRTAVPTATPSTPSPSASAPEPTPSSHRRDRHRSRPSGRDGIRRGSTGPEVADLQGRLQRLQLYLGPADGVFDASLETALRRYQVARNIPQEDGAYGPLTRAVLRAETG